MSNIKKLVEEVILPECEIELSLETRRHHEAFVRHGHEPRSKKCGNRARYRIDGKHMCKKHAGLYLLDNYERITLEELK